MWYLKPDFTAGFTLSINKDKGWEEAFDYICEKLERLKEKGGKFAGFYCEMRRTKSNAVRED